ncbi:MAG: RagB/SusD family nutrient uptake outer membrane protein [Bacteroides sp.]|nr:RagB/SusD family nutrient uptake outer membrane protein [Bacteroides sp.]
MRQYKIASILLAGVMAFGMASCSESFLDEENVREKTLSYFETPEGIDDLSAGAYINFRWSFQYDWGGYLQEIGTDEMGKGQGNGNCPLWDAYDVAINSSRGEINNLWSTMDGMIEQANLLIQNVQMYYPQDNANYNIHLGEGYFMRGWAYYMLTSHFGGVPLALSPANGKITTCYHRNTEKECWDQVITDLENAYKLLPEKPVEKGKLHRYAAAHFLAKAYLWRASERSDAFNADTKTSDLDNVIKYAKEVIANHPLANNYNELWARTDVNSAAESLPEIVFAAQYEQKNDTHDRYGNQQHLYFSCVYQNLPGMARDISGGREFNACRPSLYTVEVFDRVNDSRFWKSFVTRHNSNNGGTIPKYSADDETNGVIPAGKSVGDKRFEVGEAGVLYIVNSLGDTRYTAHNLGKDGIDVQGALKDGKLVGANTFVYYFKDDTKRSWNDLTLNQGNNIHQQFNRGLTLGKYRDGSRPSIADQKGGFDGIIARSAEDYLMIAEAYVRKKDYGSALPYINDLRKRAGYEAGEDRGYYIDGGIAYKTNPNIDQNTIKPTFSDRNTYYESNNLPETETGETKNALLFSSYTDCYNNPTDKLILDQLNLSSEYDKMMGFILNERTRELCGEMQRWGDLVRTKTLESRYKAFNYSASQGNFNPQKHYLHPIPQSWLDLLTNESGANLSADEKQAMQNPGY